MTTITASTLREWLTDDEELAVLDIRSREEVGYASPLFATNLPADEVLANLPRFVPRKTVRTVLIDGGDGTAQKHVATLRADGWTAVSSVEGGIPAWLAQGDLRDLPTFDTPGVDFVREVEKERGTPSVTATDVKELREKGEDVVVVDTRTLPEFTGGHVPGAVGVPGAELLLRLSQVVPSPDTHIVVSCAGLPRAVLGAQTLIDAGVPNRVSYLYNGTRAWTEDGGVLETGATATFGPDQETDRTAAAARVDALSSKDDFPHIDDATAIAWAADPGRTTYLLDVRTPQEYEAGHLQGSISSEGGQLLGVAYRTIAVRGARVVLIDDQLGARAAVVAHWLQRRGYEIAILLRDFGR